MNSPLLRHGTYVVEQHRKLFEMRNQYRVFDQSGQQVGQVEQVKQSPLAVLARFSTDLDVALPMSLEINDVAGATVLKMHKPWFRRTFNVARGDGTSIGSISKRVRMGKARFTIRDASGAEIGEVRAENWRAKDFVVADSGGGEVMRTTKKWRGLATEMFTDADTYVVSMQSSPGEPLLSLALASTLAIDVIMKQND